MCKLGCDGAIALPRQWLPWRTSLDHQQLGALAHANSSLADQDERLMFRGLLYYISEGRMQHVKVRASAS